MTVSSAQPPVVWRCQFGQISRLNYGNSESMSAIISASAPVTLSFTAFDTEQGYDEVTVSSCPTTACSTTVLLLDHYSGSTIQSPLSSSTGIMLIEWYSDGSVTKSGWSAVWSAGALAQSWAVIALTHARTDIRPIKTNTGTYDDGPAERYHAL